MTTCKICNRAVEQAHTTFHDDCKLCKYCNHGVGEDIIHKLIKEHSASSRGDGSSLGSADSPESDSPEQSLEIYHPYCRNIALENEWKNKSVSITQSHLDLLNAVNLMFRPNLNISIETNQKEAELHAVKYIHEMSMGLTSGDKEISQLVVLKRMEAVAAMWSIALNKETQKRISHEMDLKRIKNRETQESEERIEFETKKIAKREKEAVRLSPELRNQEKAVKAMMQFGGMTREQALASIQEQKNKRIQ